MLTLKCGLSAICPKVYKTAADDVPSRDTSSALARVASVWKVTMTSFCVIRLSGLGVHLMSIYARLSFQLNTQLYTCTLKNII
jgi:hypothetical protein